MSRRTRRRRRRTRWTELLLIYIEQYSPFHPIVHLQTDQVHLSTRNLRTELPPPADTSRARASVVRCCCCGTSHLRGGRGQGAVQVRERRDVLDDRVQDGERRSGRVDEDLRCRERSAKGTDPAVRVAPSRERRREGTHDDAVRHEIGGRDRRDVRRLPEGEIQTAEEKVVQLGSQLWMFPKGGPGTRQEAGETEHCLGATHCRLLHSASASGEWARLPMPPDRSPILRTEASPAPSSTRPCGSLAPAPPSARPSAQESPPSRLVRSRRSCRSRPRAPRPRTTQAQK